MIADVVDLLACPVCARDLALDGSRLACDSGHSFDLNRRGYVDLVAPVGKRAPTGDTAGMVADRAGFLAAGHYEPIVVALRRAFSGFWTDGTDRVVADLGCGPGYYLNRLLDDPSPFARGIATDVSTAALATVARGPAPVGAVRANSKTTLPIRDGSVDAVTVIFAPRNPAEWHRILRPDGLLAVVIPTESHLVELRGLDLVLDIEREKRERLLREVDDRFVPAGRERIEWRLESDAAIIGPLIGMGPSAFHSGGLGALAAASLPESVTASVELNLFTPR